MPNCLERHFLCKEVNWGLPTQHFQKGFVWVSIKNIKKKIYIYSLDSENNGLDENFNVIIFLRLQMKKKDSLSLLVFNVTCNDHICDGTCAGGLKKKLNLQSGSQRHRLFAGFFNVPVLHRHGTTLLIRWFRHTAPISRLLQYAGDTEDVFST